MFFRRLVLSWASVSTCLFLPMSLMLVGCSNLQSTSLPGSAVSATGNWQLSSSAVGAAKLPAFSGELSGSSTALNGIFHSNSSAACVSPNSSFPLNGSANGANLVTLSGPVAGGTLTLTGTLATDGKSLLNVSYNVSGGLCAFSSAAVAKAQKYASITGTFAGSFFDASSSTTPVLSITSQLTQSPASNTDGNYTLTGSGTLPNNPCFTSPTAVVSSQVSGASFTFTYTDAVTTNSVVVSGNFSTDGTLLSVTNWTLSGPCGPDTGTGSMVKQ